MIGEKLRALRHARGVTQTDLAKRAKVALGYIGMMETGVKANPSLAVLQRIATALEVTVSDLLADPPSPRPSRSLSLGRVRHLLAKAHWIYARTMPKTPHHYTLRKTWTDDDFVGVVQYIREHGVTEVFRGTRYKILIADGYKYWSMGAPIEKTVLINRKEVATDGAQAKVGELLK